MNETGRDLLDKWESQMRKGMLDFIILLCLEKEQYYGYELIKQIKNVLNLDISEGTIYPLLNRLKAENLISSKWVERERGIPRKYYQITDAGKIVLEKMREAWRHLTISISLLLEKSL